MSSEFGHLLKISVFGQSHGRAIGAVVDGLPAGEAIDLDELQAFLDRRKPGRNRLSTARKEADAPTFLSGLENGKTCGAPLCAVIENGDQHSGDYAGLTDTPRPGHAVAGIADDPFPLHPTAELFEKLAAKDVPVLSDDAGERMQQAILAAREELDSVGGIVECAAIGLPAGLGDPMFDGVENRLAAALFGIPAVKGVEFGAGFAAARSRGSENNDAFSIADGAVVTDTNHAGGILGGITNGMPILLRTAMKPTPSIARAQKTVRLSQMEEIPLEIRGRHDPCIAHRAVPVVEAVTAAVLLDLLLEGNHGTF